MKIATESPDKLKDSIDLEGISGGGGVFAPLPPNETVKVTALYLQSIGQYIVQSQGPGLQGSCTFTQKATRWNYEVCIHMM